jgi:hypothetical protein
MFVTSSHQDTEIYIVLWGGGKETPPKNRHKFGELEIIKRVNDVGYQRLEDPRSNETSQAGA